jgi:hypothetical protein
VLLLGINLLGLVGLFAGARALVHNRRDARRDSIPSGLRIAAVGFGFLLAAASIVFVYPLGNRIQVVGLPFTAAAFENGADFVGPLTLPAYIANATFWFLCPQLFLRMLRRSTDTTAR